MATHTDQLGVRRRIEIQPNGNVTKDISCPTPNTRIGTADFYRHGIPSQEDILCRKIHQKFAISDPHTKFANAVKLIRAAASLANNETEALKTKKTN